MDFLVLEDFLGKRNVLDFFFSFLLSKQAVASNRTVCGDRRIFLVGFSFFLSFFFFEEISEVDLIRVWRIEDDLNSGLIPPAATTTTFSK